MLNKLIIRKFIVFIIVLLVFGSACKAQSSRNPERRIFGKSINGKREVKVKAPRTVNKAKRKQEAKLEKQKKDYALFVNKSKKRSIAIQTPEVQSRMIQNQKDSEANYKAKKKKLAAGSKNAARKYKK